MNRHKISGMTLIEVILVLAIAASLILAGLRMYQSSKTDNDYLILRSNVDFLFQAMKGYYQQECDLYFSTTNGSSFISKRGTLTFNPSGGTPATDFSAPIRFDVTTVNNYIDLPWPRFVSVVALDTPVNTYFAQFNYNVGTNKNYYVCSSYATGTPQCSNPQPISGSNIVLWQSQIVVKMKDPTSTTYYLANTGADCAVNTYAPGDIIDCSQGLTLGQSAQYMVWQRMPSFASQDVRSSLWVSNPVTKEFKLQYTHDPMYEMYNPGGAPSDVYTYYYCGG